MNKQVIFFEKELANIQLFVITDMIDLERSFAIHYNSRNYDLKTIHDRGIRCDSKSQKRHIKWVPSKISFDINISPSLKIRLRIDTLRNITVAFVTHAPHESWVHIEQWLNDHHHSPVILDLADLRQALEIVDSFAANGMYTGNHGTPIIEGVSVIDNDPESESSSPMTEESQLAANGIFRRPSFNGSGAVQSPTPANIALLQKLINPTVFHTLFFIGRRLSERPPAKSGGGLLFTVLMAFHSIAKAAFVVIYATTESDHTWLFTMASKWHLSSELNISYVKAATMVSSNASTGTNPAKNLSAKSKP